MNSFTLAEISLAVAVGAAVASFLTATRQNHLTTIVLANGWLRDVRQWAVGAIELLSQAEYALLDEGASASATQQAFVISLRQQLSQTVEQGRLFFPNVPNADVKQPELTDPAADHGYRHRALDALVAAERVLADKLQLFEFPNKSSALHGLCREFVSQLQGIIDPDAVNRIVSEALRKGYDRHIDDLERSGLVVGPGELPPGAEGILLLASHRYSRGNRGL